jgi:citrate synthase
MIDPTQLKPGLDPSQFKPGLDGVVAALTSISEIDGEHGTLIFRGYSISDLADHCTFEEVAYLLWMGQLPTASELTGFKARLAGERTLPANVIQVITSLPKDSDPMDVLRTAISAFGTTAKFKGKPTLEQAISLTARIPTINADFFRYREDLPIVAPREDLDHAANFLYMMTGSEPPANHARSLDSYLVLLADHGMNASTFTARVIASTESDLCSAITGAIGALKGPLHGGAPALTMNMLNTIGKPENARPWIEHELNNGGRIMGIGHRVYKTYDPRAEILREMARHAATPEFFDLAYTTEQVALLELRRRKPNERLWTNVDFYAATMLHAVGLPGDFFPATFAASRVCGWSTHVLEQMQKNRLMRPESIYVGSRKTFLPIEQRVNEE